MRSLIVLIVVLFAAITIDAQSCPKENTHGLGEAPEPSVLHGTLLYHDELRQWLGLGLDHAACGQTEVQLIFNDSNKWRHAESLRECAVTVSGKLYIGPTGYYSAEMAISDPELKPDPSCRPLPLKPDPAAVPISTDLKEFHASIAVDYRGKGHVEVKVRKEQDKGLLLEPWQAFVHYNLNGGGDMIWFGCRESFQISDITQVPKSPTGIIQDKLDSSTVLVDMDGTNTVAFTCQKKRGPRDAKLK